MQAAFYVCRAEDVQVQVLVQGGSVCSEAACTSCGYLNVPTAVQNFLPVHDARVVIPLLLFIVAVTPLTPVLQIRTNCISSVMKVCCPSAIVTRTANMSTGIAHYSLYCRHSFAKEELIETSHVKDFRPEVWK